MYVYKVSLDFIQTGFVYSNRIEEVAHSPVLSIRSRALFITQANIRKTTPARLYTVVLFQQLAASP